MAVKCPTHFHAATLLQDRSVLSSRGATVRRFAYTLPWFEVGYITLIHDLIAAACNIDESSLGNPQVCARQVGRFMTV